jgi:hypothetical protein
VLNPETLAFSGQSFPAEIENIGMACHLRMPLASLIRALTGPRSKYG